MSWIDAVLSSEITPITITVVTAGLILFAFSKGWILTSWQIKALTDVQNLRIQDAAALVLAANERADDYRQLYDAVQEQNSVLVKQLDTLTPAIATLNRFLNALPDPRPEGETS